MGVYLMIIGFYDMIFEEKYLSYALQWSSSWQCSFCGFLAMLSSELSVLVLVLITVERYRCITANFRVVTPSSAKLNLISVWLLALFIASYPIFFWKNPLKSSSGSWTIFGSSSFYYGSSGGLCFPLHIDEPFNPGQCRLSLGISSNFDRRQSGWEYSSIVFIGINFSAVLIIIFLYLHMFSSIKSDRKFTRPATLAGDAKKKREDMVLAVRFFAIVMTDCLCWFPIVIIKMLAFTSISLNRKHEDLKCHSSQSI